jgi:hypothetical protein
MAKRKNIYYTPNHGWGISVSMANDVDSDLDRHDPPHMSWEYPYSYDPFTVWGGRNPKCNGSVYTDRMSQWDYKKFSETGLKVFGNPGNLRWFAAGCDPEKVQKFMRLYFGNNTIELTRIVEYCNISNGYPVWRLDYHSEPFEG